MQSCDVKSHFGREDLHFPTAPHGSETALLVPPGRLSPPSGHASPGPTPFMPSCTPRPRSRTPRPSKNTLQQLNQTCRRQRSVAPASTRWHHASPPGRITTPRPQSASTTSRLSTRRTARENSCLAPATYRRRSPTNATEARDVLDSSKTAPRRRRM